MVGELREAGMLSKTTVTRPGRPVGPRRARVLPALALVVLPCLVLADAAAARSLSGVSVAGAVGRELIVRADEVVEPAIPTGTQSVLPLPAGRIGRSYSRRLTGPGGTPPYRFALESGSLPAGLTLSEDGVLSGTPTGAGDWSFTARVVDSGGQSATQFYHLRIVSAGPPRH